MNINSNIVLNKYFIKTGMSSLKTKSFQSKTNNMKKVFLQVLGSCLLLILSAPSFGQAFQQGKSYAGVGYGIGFTYKLWFDVYDSEANFDLNSFGPLCLKYDYGINDRWSAGLYFATQRATGKWTDSFSDIFNPQNTEDYTYEVKVGTTALLGRVQYHFKIPNEKLDFYTGCGLGYRNYKFSSKSNDQTFDYDYSFGGAFGFCLTVGARYEFSPLVGAYSELGLGQVAAIQAGLVTKF